MKNIHKKVKHFLKKTFFIYCFFFLILVIFIASKDKNETFVNNDALSVNFLTSDIMKITNVLPVSDKLGKTFTGDGSMEGVQDYVEFSVSNNGDEKYAFQILLTRQFLEELDIKENYVKMYLTDENDVPVRGFEKYSVPSYIDLSYSDSELSSKVLYNGIIDSGESKRYKLHMWLSDSYSISNVLESFSVDVDVRIKWRNNNGKEKRT